MSGDVSRFGVNKPASGIPAKGPGWGGPPKGTPAVPFSAENQPSPEAKSLGQLTAQEMRDLAATKARKAIETIEGVMNSEAEPGMVRGAMADKLLDRAFGKPGQPVTGADNGPVEIVYRWADPPA